MVTTASNNFEGGTNGVAVTASNSGGASGTAFDIMFGTALTYSTAAATQGTMGASVATSAIGAAGWNLANVTKCSAHMKFTISAVPTTGDMYLMRYHNSGGTRLFDVHVQGTGKLRIFDASGATVWTGTNVLTPSTVYRLEAYVVAGSTASNGTIKVGYYLGNSTTPVETVYLNTAANVGTASSFAVVYMGKYNNAVESYTFDELALDTTLSDFIGVPTASPPTVSITANQNVAANAAVSATVTASSSSGTITGYAWSVLYSSTTSPTLTGASTTTVSLTATSDTTKGHLYILQCVVTDSNSLTTTVTTEVRVPCSGDVTTLPGVSASTSGSWSNVGGAASGGDALADNSDTTYVESSALSATEQSIRYRLAPMTARSSLTLTVRLEQDTSGSTTAKVRLFEGSTQRQQWTQAITTAFNDYALSLTSPGAVADWGNLYLEAAATSP